MLSPETIVNILKIDPLFWRNIHDSNKSGNFSQIQNNALDLITSILENINDRERQGEILQHISCNDLSLLYLFLPFIGWQIKNEQRLFIEDPDIDFGTADHLFEIIRWAAPQVAEQIFYFIYAAEISLLYFITDLWSEAFDDLETDHDYLPIEALMFVPVDLNDCDRSS